jgi:hypothetical protein
MIEYVNLHQNLTTGIVGWVCTSHSELREFFRCMPGSIHTVINIDPDVYYVIDPDWLGSDVDLPSGDSIATAVMAYLASK